ncbi:MFS transporter [Actinomadura sediminis]|uniref:MFS transporter n=1 Tax=Actinomadura sediminis TaxID=1038904 RepID=A0ABW3EYS5_9ACTN
MAKDQLSRSLGRRRRTLVVLCFVQYMLVLDDTVVSVALPSIKDDLGFGTTGLAWVVNTYFLAFGGFLLLSGRAADLVGRRRVFLSGVALFGAASLACGAAQEPWQLLSGRFLQGMGAAMASPAALSMITLLFPRERERARALSVWGGIAALGGTSGLVISGVLTDLASWRWIFLINLPVAVMALGLIPRLVGESRSARRTFLDVPGSVLGTAATLALVFGLLQVGEAGPNDPAFLLSMLLAVVLATAFITVEARTSQPLVPLPFLAARTRTVANAATLLFSAAFYAMAFLLMLQLQTVIGYGPLEAGLAYLPYGAGLLAAMWLSSRAVPRFGVRPTLVLSFLTSAVGLLLLSRIAPGDGYVGGVLPGMIVTSVGCGLSLPALAVAAVAGTTEDDAGLGSAVFSSVQQLGGAVGLAALVTVAVRHDSASSDPASQGFSLALTVAAILLTTGAALIAAMLRGRRSATPADLQMTPARHH